MEIGQKLYRLIYGLLLLAMGGLIFQSILNTEWSDLFVILQAIAICSIPFFLEKYFTIHTPYILRTTFILFMFFTLILGEIADLYNTISWWDVMLHFVSSAGITIIGFILIVIIYRERDLKSSPWLSSFLALSFALSLAVIWEIYEFVIDVFFVTDTPMQLSNTDTMTDLIFAVVGSLIVCVYGYNYLKRQSPQNIIEKTIEEGKVNNI